MIDIFVDFGLFSFDSFSEITYVLVFFGKQEKHLLRELILVVREDISWDIDVFLF